MATRKKPKKYYIVCSVQPWSSISVEMGGVEIPIVQADKDDAVGYAPVFTNKAKAKKAYPTSQLLQVESVVGED